MQETTENCPICDWQIVIPEGTEVSEILTCPDCGNKVVVENRDDTGKVVLAAAPEVEEDWGQ